MPFAIIILTRVLFIVCMVFIIGYVFGNFSKSPVLTTFTRISAILAIVLFLSTNALFLRYRGGFRGNTGFGCYHEYRDTTLTR